MQLNDMEITSFSQKRPNRPYTARSRYAYTNRQRGRVRTRAGSMLLKIGFCIAVLAAAVFVQHFILEDGDVRAVVEASADETERENNEADDVLGRLRFVEAGGTRSVFATSQRWRMPVNGTGTALLEEDTILQINGKAGDTVSVSAAGEVRAVAHDVKMGDYVRVHHGSDLESVYYNLRDIRVENGQPLLAGDTLGTVGDTGMLYVAVTQSGAPLLPTSFLNVSQ